MNKNKAIILLLNKLENQCETFYKQLDVEGEKATHDFIRNPKKMDLLFSNFQVDIENDLQELQKFVPSFYENVKGDLNAYENAALHFIDCYKIGPVRFDASAKLDFSKKIQNSKDEMRSLLDQIFTKIRNEFSI